MSHITRTWQWRRKKVDDSSRIVGRVDVDVSTEEDASRDSHVKIFANNFKSNKLILW